MKANSPINPALLKLFQYSLFILHLGLGGLAVRLFCIGGYVVWLGEWAVRAIGSGWLDSAWLVRTVICKSAERIFPKIFSLKLFSNS